MNDQQNFFKLLKYSNELKRNNKYLDKEDPEVEIAMSDEKELKDYAQILLFKLQEE